MDFGGGCVEGFGFVGCQAYFDNAFDTGSTKLDGDADEQVVDAVLAREIGGTREDTLLVTNDGFDHFGDGCGDDERSYAAKRYFGSTRRKYRAAAISASS